MLDDLGDQLHIGYLGHDPARAAGPGYREVRPGVFGVLVAREDVTDIAEERVGRPYPPHAATVPQAPAAAPAPVPAGAPAGASRRSRSGAGAERGDRTRQTFADLVDLAALPRDAYAVGEPVDGAFCLVKTETGFEVFSAVDGTKQEVRRFADEEAAYFYLFGLLAAEAVRDGRLVPWRLRQD